MAMGSADEVGAEEESEVRAAVVDKASNIMDMLFGNVLESLLALGLDVRVKVREEALQALDTSLCLSIPFSTSLYLHGSRRGPPGSLYLYLPLSTSRYLTLPPYTSIVGGEALQAIYTSMLLNEQINHYTKPLCY